MPSLSFEDLQSAAHENYEDFILELPDDKSVTFPPLLRLPKATRKKVSALFKPKEGAEDEAEEGAEEETDDRDFVDVVKEYFKLRLSASDHRKLSAAIYHDDTFVLQLFEMLSAAEGLGEA